MKSDSEFWDRIADKYARDPITDMVAYQYTLDRTRSYLNAGDRVLELGAGTGSTALLLAPEVDSYVASDFSQRMAEIAQQKVMQAGVKNLTMMQAGISDQSLADAGPYDVVLALNLLHLIPDAKSAIAQIAKLTKPGGMFISKTVCEFGRGTSWKFRLMKMALPIAQFLGKAPFVKFMKIDQLEQLIADQGFVIVETCTSPADPPIRYVVARRN